MLEHLNYLKVEGRPIVDVAVEHTDLPREELERLLDPARLTGEEG